MDSEILKIVSHVAGIGGIGLGVLLIVFRDIIRKKIFPTLTKEQGYALLRLIAILVWAIAIVAVGAWVWVSTHTSNADTTAFRALEIHDRTSKLRDLLSTDSNPVATSLNAICPAGEWGRNPPKKESIKLAAAPNAFAVQQVVALARVDRSSVIEALVPLLRDPNVTVSSGAVVALARIFAGISPGKGRNALLAMIPPASELASGEQPSNFKAATLRDQDLTPLADTDIFYGAEMYGADLSGSKLNGITFKTANLSCAMFVQASAANAIFDMANLARARFWGASAPRASFRHAHLQDTDFSQHEVADPQNGSPFPTTTSYAPANLEGADFGDSQAYGTNFSGARLGGARFEGASLSEADFRGSFVLGMAPITEGDIRSTHPAVFEGCIFR